MAGDGGFRPGSEVELRARSAAQVSRSSIGPRPRRPRILTALIITQGVAVMTRQQLGQPAGSGLVKIVLQQQATIEQLPASAATPEDQTGCLTSAAEALERRNGRRNITAEGVDQRDNGCRVSDIVSTGHVQPHRVGMVPRYQHERRGRWVQVDLGNHVVGALRVVRGNERVCLPRACARLCPRRP